MLSTFFFYFFVVSWKWVTIRLKTKKHTFIRVFIALAVTILNIIAIISIANDTYIKEDKNAYSIMMIFWVFSLLLWACRFISDLLFLSKKTFQEKETELSSIIKEKFNVDVNHKNKK